MASASFLENAAMASKFRFASSAKIVIARPSGNAWKYGPNGVTS